MKRIFLLFSFLVAVVFTSYASNSNKNGRGKNLKTTQEKKRKVSYEWGFIPGSPCLHLFAIDDSGYINSNGMYMPGNTITVCTPLNYAGQSQICPPTGSAYC